MITGIKKSHKTTEIFFDEGSDILVINTYNTSLKNRLTAYARVYPDLCRQTDDNETGGLSFEIQKDRRTDSPSAFFRHARTSVKKRHEPAQRHLTNPERSFDNNLITIRKNAGYSLEHVICLGYEKNNRKVGEPYGKTQTTR